MKTSSFAHVCQTLRFLIAVIKVGVLGAYRGGESHPPPPSLCVQEDLSLPPPLPTPFPLACLCAAVRACWGLRPESVYILAASICMCACGLKACGLMQYLRAWMLASLRPSSIRGSACALDALLDAGGCVVQGGAWGWARLGPGWAGDYSPISSTSHSGSNSYSECGSS